MAKMWASTAGKDRDAGHAGAAKTQQSGERLKGAAPALDPDMLELVQRFERGYAELAPAADEPPGRAAASDELFPEFPDMFDEPAPARTAANESRRVVPMTRREPELAAAAPAARSREPVPGTAAEVDLDEAMAILRAAEHRGRPAPQPGVDEEDEPQRAEPPIAAAPDARARTTGALGNAGTHDAVPVFADRAADRTWAAKSHGLRTLAVTAAVAALAVGVAAGYVLGHRPSAQASSAHIDSSTGGGTQLRLERNLPQR